jgi:hypothetical protein
MLNTTMPDLVLNHYKNMNNLATISTIDCEFKFITHMRHLSSFTTVVGGFSKSAIMLPKDALIHDIFLCLDQRPERCYNLDTDVWLGC